MGAQRRQIHQGSPHASFRYKGVAASRGGCSGRITTPRTDYAGTAAATSSLYFMEAVRIPSGGAILHGDLEHAGSGEALVLFAHGSGSGRKSPRNQQVAASLRNAGIGTLLFD